MCLFFRWWILRAFRLETNERCICILPHRRHTILLLETPCPLVRSYSTIFTPPHQSYMWACTLDFWRREMTGRTRRTRTSTTPISYHNTNILPQYHTTPIYYHTTTPHQYTTTIPHRRWSLSKQSAADASIFGQHPKVCRSAKPNLWPKNKTENSRQMSTCWIA